ncbi:MAG: hypothetical protein QM758_24975 [Armatimonas sp.]
MRNLRATRMRTLIPSMTALALLLGTALLTHAIRPENRQGGLSLTEAFARDESPVSQCQHIAELLEQGRLTEAEPLLVAMPTAPISMDAIPNTDAFRTQAQALLRLSKAMIEASLKQGKDGKRDEALERIRLCRAMLNFRGDSPQALEVSHKITSLADTAESQLRYRLI